MIEARELRNGIIVRARRPRGNMHREFSIWQSANMWRRFKPDFGEISGLKTTENLLRYLNKYDFEVIGEWEVRYYQPHSPMRDKFDLDGAL